ncbi:MAG TPA: hypothetical protein VGD65_03240, partial [Chryseosolibacter sp.]
DPSRFTLINKINLFLRLVSHSSLERIALTLEEIQKIQTSDDRELKIPSVECFRFVNRIAGLRKASVSQFPLADTSQFHNRVFATHLGKLSIPLFKVTPGQERSETIVNFIYLNNGHFKYFNDRKDWLTATHFQPENRFMLLTSDPARWLDHFTTNYGPDYFLLLCHPHPPDDVLEVIQSILDRLDFQELMLTSPRSQNDWDFVANLIEHILNRSVEGLGFKIASDEHCFVIAVRSDGVNLLGFMERVITEFNESILQSIHHSTSTFAQGAGILGSVQITPHIYRSRDAYILKFDLMLHETICQEFFSQLFNAFGIKKGIKFC